MVETFVSHMSCAYLEFEREKHMNTDNKKLNLYEEYLHRFATTYGITIEEASEKAIVKAVRKQYLEGDM